MTFYTHKNKTQQGSPSKHAQPWNLWPKNILDVICRYLQIIYFSTFFPYVFPKPSSQDLSPRTKSSVRVAGLVVSASRNSESPSSNSSPGREPVPEVIFAGGIGEKKKESPRVVWRWGREFFFGFFVVVVVGGSGLDIWNFVCFGAV